jgi:hypothetical protein
MRKKALWILSIVVLLALVSATVGLASSFKFRTHLSGDEEVPPPGVVVSTKAQGQAIFRLSKDGQSMHYTLVAANIENVVMAHIHHAPRGQNGPVVVWLYPGTAPMPAPPGQGRMKVLVKGTFTADDLQPSGGISTLEELVAAMEAGNTYVNVHTNDGVDPANTGPGDFPGGEIRGQIH